MTTPFSLSVRLLLPAALLAFPPMLRAQPQLQPSTTLSVAGSVNLWRAGGNTRSTGPANFDGANPTAISLAEGTGRYVTVTGVSGLVYCYPGSPASPADGAYCTSAPGTDMPASGALSGITVGTQMFLAGVFLADGVPDGAAPASLVYGPGGASEGAASISPLLNQTFFVGDGLGAGDVVQQFLVPTGATRLFLGYGDSWNGAVAFRDPAGAYGDNQGALSATVHLYGGAAAPTSAVPEPTTWALLATGLVAVGGVTRRRRAD